jgi:hypothetical protein
MILRILGTVQTLSEFDNQQLQITYKALEEKTFKTGENIVIQGVKSSALFVIKHGHVKEIESVDGQVCFGSNAV